jgi:hypothetical protein
MRFLLLIAGLAVAPGEPPARLEALGRFDVRRLPEVSGIAASGRHPGIFWVHNDSGNPPALFAVRRDGRLVREFPLRVPNIDWEDIAADAQGHLYVGDIGNNGGLLAVRVVYRFDEPDVGKPPPGPLSPTAAWFYRFPEGGRFDAEGLFLQDGGRTAVLVSKRLDGKPAELFAIPLEKPAPLLRPALARRVGMLPGFVEPATGASLSPDGTRLAVCSYAVTRVYQTERDATWRLLAEVRYPSAPVEGVTWDGRDLVLVSEGRGIDLIRDPLSKVRESGSDERTP